MVCPSAGLLQHVQHCSPNPSPDRADAWAKGQPYFTYIHPL